MCMASLRISNENLTKFRNLSDTRTADRFMTILLNTYEMATRKVHIVEIGDDAYARLESLKDPYESVDDFVKRIIHDESMKGGCE